MNAYACRVDEDAEFCSKLLAAIEVWERWSPDASSKDPQAHNLFKALLRQGALFGNWHMDAPTRAAFLAMFGADRGPLEDSINSLNGFFFKCIYLPLLVFYLALICLITSWLWMPYIFVRYTVRRMFFQ